MEYNIVEKRFLSVLNSQSIGNKVAEYVTD